MEQNERVRFGVDQFGVAGRVTSLVPAFFADIYENPDQVHRLQVRV